MSNLSLSPQENVTRFFQTYQSSKEEFNQFIIEFHERTQLSIPFLESEIRKFYYYWTEPTKNGKKQRWETEKTFEIKRRLTRWLENASKWSNKDVSKYRPELI